MLWIKLIMPGKVSYLSLHSDDIDDVIVGRLTPPTAVCLCVLICHAFGFCICCRFLAIGQTLREFTLQVQKKCSIMLLLFTFLLKNV